MRLKTLRGKLLPRRKFTHIQSKCLKTNTTVSQNILRNTIEMMAYGLLFLTIVTKCLSRKVEFSRRWNSLSHGDRWHEANNFRLSRVTHYTHKHKQAHIYTFLLCILMHLIMKNKHPRRVCLHFKYTWKKSFVFSFAHLPLQSHTLSLLCHGIFGVFFFQILESNFLYFFCDFFSCNEIQNSAIVLNRDVTLTTLLNTFEEWNEEIKPQTKNKKEEREKNNKQQMSNPVTVSRLMKLTQKKSAATNSSAVAVAAAASFLCRFD